MYSVFFDGLCEPKNPGGIATFGFVVYDDAFFVDSGNGFVARGRGASNNLAEYTALVRALEWLLDNNIRVCAVYGDSQLVIRQMSNVWAMRGGLYLPAYKRARELTERFERLEFVWVPREMNAAADEQSRIAYENYCKVNGLVVRYHSNGKRE
jgi:ribonuclease HI